MLSQHIAPVIAYDKLGRRCRTVQGECERDTCPTQARALESCPASAAQAVTHVYLYALTQQYGDALDTARVASHCRSEQLGRRIGEFAEYQSQAIGGHGSRDRQGGEPCACRMSEDSRGVRERAHADQKP
jgi:hypothetical protein